MSTIHNPVNFKPEDYQVVGYLDNQPPRYYGGNVAMFATAREDWLKWVQSYFPKWPAESPNIHKCAHCGNSRVRYISICLHKPTNTKVVFGDICVERLEFEGHNEFAAAKIRSKAAIEAKLVAHYEKGQKFLADNPTFATALEHLKTNVETHKRNSFAHDVASKFNHYHDLSEAQVNAFVNSINRDVDYHARRQQQQQAQRGPVPTGERITIEGLLVSYKHQESQFGEVTKMLIRLDNGSAIWMTMPSSYSVQENPAGKSRLKVRATVTASKDDPSFGFGNRPHIISVTPLQPQPTNEQKQETPVHA